MSRSKQHPDRSTGAARSTSGADIHKLYLLALARPPETEQVVEVMSSQPLAVLFGALFGSIEFSNRVSPLRDGQDPWGSAPPPGRQMAAWAARRLPLTRAGRDQVARATWSWAALFHALASDKTFIEATQAVILTDPAVFQALSTLARVRGAVERADAQSVSGWVVAPEDQTGSARVELWIDGAFVAATTADRFRRDIQDHIGGDGHIGFVFQIPPHLGPASEVVAEVRLPEDGAVLGARRISLEGVRPDAITSIRAELTQLKLALERIEQTLPAAIASAGGSTLGEWADYYQTWYSDLEVDRPPTGRWAVFIDATGADPGAVQRSLAAVCDQACVGDRLIVIASREQEAMAADLVRRARLLGSADARTFQSEAVTPSLRLEAALALAGDRSMTLVIHAGDVVAPAALALLTRRFQKRRSIHVVYVDEDRLSPLGPREGPNARHADPILKPGPDQDLLHQSPYVGRTLAFRTASLIRALPTGPGGSESWYGAAALLNLMETPAAVDHLPLVLVTRTKPDPEPEDQQRAWGRVIGAKLKQQGEKAEIGPYSDILGAASPGALKIIRSTPPGVRASIIIATRDRLDLLAPCIDSIMAHKAANKTDFDLCIVDHESTDPDTRAYLSRLEEQGAQVIPFSGAFNWALMNNIGASKTKSDVLVFLNNDTMVLSPDWLDALSGQALRPEVGVVGCRLLYHDGAIQHGGFVSRGDGPDALVHDGVGEPGSVGGYLARYAMLRTTPLVTGACIAVSRSVFEKLGGFDAANFPVEGNDADFCFRARASGLRIIYSPYATLYHLESKTRRFNYSREKRETASVAMALLRDRWPDQYREDPGYNPHFNRIGRPFESLRPPLMDY